MYRNVIYPILQRIDAERTHDIVLQLLSRVERAPRLRALLRRLLSCDDPRLAVTVGELHFANPLGVAAGLDKNGLAVQTWGTFGFGHVEVGTVTPQAQPGNPRPRLFRLPPDRAVINRMGFPGHGADVVRQRLTARSGGRPIVGVNIGANKTSVEEGRASDDYIRALEQVYVVADYITVNVSSPNTVRLRELQGRAALDALVGQVTARRDAFSARKPLFIKVAPDLSAAELDDILAVCTAYHVDGIIATNTTIARPSSLRSAARSESGGLSGAPLRQRANDVIRYLYSAAGDTLPIIGVGGVFTAEDVLAKLAAGACLVQLYTGVIYEGPLVAWRINRELVRLMEQRDVGLAQLAAEFNSNERAVRGKREDHAV